MEQWLSESRKQLAGIPAPFGVVVDMRTLSPLPADAKDVMVRGQKLYKEAGMQRSAVVLSNPITTSQFQRLAKESGIYAWERYIDASSEPNWQEKAVNWIKSASDPERKTAA
jgi:hypothetical protein